MKQRIQRALRRLGYEVHRAKPPPPAGKWNSPPPDIAAIEVNPFWPLPRDKNGPTDQQIRDEFSKYEDWHYAYEFEGGLSFPRRYQHEPAPFDPRRHLQRFRHFMPYLLAAEQGSLRGKRVLDIACNSGYWSLQCALLGAEVVGIDARPELIEQANLIKRIVGAPSVHFQRLDFWEMTPQALGGTFDVVLSLGILYHLEWPAAALRLTKSMARGSILLDTDVYPCTNSVVRLQWEEADDIRHAHRSGIVAAPSKSSIDLILRDLGVTQAFEIPIRTKDVPQDYLDERRASWLIKV